MHHFRRLTDENVGLILSLIALFSVLNNWKALSELSSSLLVIFFFFRLIWGKGKVSKK